MLKPKQFIIGKQYLMDSDYYFYKKGNAERIHLKRLEILTFLSKRVDKASIYSDIVIEFLYKNIIIEFYGIENENIKLHLIKGTINEII